MTLIVRYLGQQNYLPVWQQMQNFTHTRGAHTVDEVWLLEHPPIFTIGQAGKAEHLLSPPETIPCLRVDRGGQVTYHGPGQLIAYTLIDLKRKNFNVREFVSLLEQTIIDLLAEYDINSNNKCEAPGVYINNKKIASIGLRVRKGCCFHGLAMNVDMDLTPFSLINPCGYPDLKITQLKEYTSCFDWQTIHEKLIRYLLENLGYNDLINCS